MRTRMDTGLCTKKKNQVSLSQHFVQLANSDYEKFRSVHSDYFDVLIFDTRHSYCRNRQTRQVPSRNESENDVSIYVRSITG